MKGLGGFVAAFAGIVVLACAADAFADIRVARPQTPGGLPFRHVLLPEETHQTIAFAWRDGSAVTFAGREALVALAPTLMMEGTHTLPRSAMHEALRDFQATLELTGTTSLLRGRLTAPPARVTDAGKILANLLTDPALPQDRLRELRKSRAAASRQADENPETLARRLLMRLILGDGAYYRILTGEPGIYERIEVADIDAWRRNILGRDGLVLVAAGPLDAEKAGAEIDQIFAGLPATANPPVRPGRPPAPQANSWCWKGRLCKPRSRLPARRDSPSRPTLCAPMLP